MSQDALRTVLQSADVVSSTSFETEDVERWPREHLAALRSSGMLKQSDYATSTTCPGCERRCLAEVEFLDTGHGVPPRAYVVCEERDDIGRVAIPLERLRQWKVDLGALAEIVAEELGAEGNVEERVLGRLWSLGKVVAREGSGDVFLARGVGWSDAREVFDQRTALRGSTVSVVLTLGEARADGAFNERTHVLPLCRMLNLDHDGLKLDMQAITETICDYWSTEALSRPKTLLAREAVLLVDVAGHQVYFRGVSLSPPPRAFQVLVLLAQQAAGGDEGWVKRETIYAMLWPGEDLKMMIYRRQIDDTIKELRRALDAVEAGAGNRLIETRPRVGHRLRLLPPDLVLV